MDFVFPEDFLWGAGSSSFQIEGGFDQDGKGLNVWDYDSREDAKRYWNGDRPDVSCDFYNRYREDIKDMAELGLKSFRFSLAWSRILPLGRGKVNEKGLDFYDRVIDELLKYNIEPFVDLYHWDLPNALAQEGGFEREGIVEDFKNYAEICFKRYGDRVKLWSTVNEPSALAYFASYCYRPERGFDLTVARNILRCHFEVVKLHKALLKNSKIGAVHSYTAIYAKSADEKDRRAASLQYDYSNNRWIEPILRGTYPEKLAQHPDIAKYIPDDYMDSINDNFEKVDFIGVNYYTPAFIGFKEGGFLDSEPAQAFCAQTDYGFITYPQGLFDSVMYVKEKFGDIPIYLTENGLGVDSTKDGFDPVEDDDRILYIQEHLKEISRVIKAGVDLRGYFYWSNFDTYECMSGYRYKFGLNSIDYKTQKRTRKKSWYYYQKCISDNMVC